MIVPRVSSGALPLDLGTSSYTYVERPNPAIVSLLSKHVLAFKTHARVLDVGCGCGANARAFHERSPAVSVVGVEPNPRAAELARLACDEVFQGTMEQWRAAGTSPAPFDALVLSDVLEHMVDPIAFIRSLQALEPVRDALWIVSVPNYAVWYNRIATVFGLQEYRWSGLWDRTHLRFFTRRTSQQLLEYCGLSIIDEACTPSVVQSAAPALRKWFEREVQRGEHLAMSESRAYKLYRDWVEPIESRVCQIWPELLGFQHVCAARLGSQDRLRNHADSPGSATSSGDDQT
jgi:SAM-dependent methyltransferase